MRNNFLVTINLLENLNDEQLNQSLNLIDWQEPVFEHLRFVRIGNTYSNIKDGQLSAISPLYLLFLYGSERLQNAFIDSPYLNKENSTPTNAHELSHQNYYDVIPLVVSNLNIKGLKKVLHYIEEEIGKDKYRDIEGIYDMSFLNNLGFIDKNYKNHSNDKNNQVQQTNIKNMITFIIDHYLKYNKKFFVSQTKNIAHLTQKSSKTSFYSEILSSFLPEAIATDNNALIEEVFDMGAKWSKEAFHTALIKGRGDLFEKHTIPKEETSWKKLSFMPDWSGKHKNIIYIENINKIPSKISRYMYENDSLRNSYITLNKILKDDTPIFNDIKETWFNPDNEVYLNQLILFLLVQNKKGKTNKKMESLINEIKKQKKNICSKNEINFFCSTWIKRLESGYHSKEQEYQNLKNYIENTAQNSSTDLFQEWYNCFFQNQKEETYQLLSETVWNYIFQKGSNIKHNDAYAKIEDDLSNNTKLMVHWMLFIKNSPDKKLQQNWNQYIKETVFMTEDFLNHYRKSEALVDSYFIRKNMNLKITHKNPLKRKM